MKRTKADLERENAALRARVAQQDKVIADLLTRPAVQYVPMPYPAPPYTVGGPTWQAPGTVIPSTLPLRPAPAYPEIVCNGTTVLANTAGAATRPGGYHVSVQ